MRRLLILTALLALFAGTALAQTGTDTYVLMNGAGAVDTLDPMYAYDTASGEILENVYETLFSYAGDSITEFEPSLATDFSISDDNRTYTFTLREGVQFHTGNTMSCKDVEYSIERILVMFHPSSGVWFQGQALLGSTSNANENPDITWELIDGAVECPEGPDGMTAVFNLPEVDPAFFTKMIYTNASIIDSQTAIANGEWDGTEDTWRDWVGVDPTETDGFLHTNVVGTGPYQLVSWDGSTVIAEAFPDYWGDQPAIQTVQVQNVDEESTRILALRQGDADRITGLTPATIFSQVEGLEGVTIWQDDAWVSTTTSAIHFNQDVVLEENSQNVGSGQLDGNGIPSDFFTDVHVRKGFAYSFDQSAILDDVLAGEGQVLTMALPPSFLGYNEDLPVYDYDPERAEEEFRLAWGGELWETGFELTISYNTGNPTRQAIAEVLKANIEDLNPRFTINTQGVQWPDFLDQYFEGQFPLFALGWAPDYADPDNYIRTFYHPEGAFGSAASVSDPELIQLVDDAYASVDPEIRQFIYEEVGRRAYEIAVNVPYPSVNVFITTRDNVDGVYYNPMYSGEFLWKDIAKN